MMMMPVMTFWLELVIAARSIDYELIRSEAFLSMSDEDYTVRVRGRRRGRGHAGGSD